MVVAVDADPTVLLTAPTVVTRWRNVFGTFRAVEAVVRVEHKLLVGDDFGVGIELLHILCHGVGLIQIKSLIDIPSAFHGQLGL